MTERTNDRWDDNAARVLVAYRNWLGPPLALVLIVLALRIFGLGLEEMAAVLDAVRPNG